MIMKNTQMKILKNNINLGGLLADELDLVLEPALQKVVDDSSNPFDDILMAAVYPVLSVEVKKLIEKHVNTLFDTDEN